MEAGAEGDREAGSRPLVTVGCVQVRSLGFRTDLALLRLGGSRIVDYPDHLSVETPSNPTFYWGNFVLLAEPPGEADVERWLRRFTELHPDAEHITIGVDSPGGSLDELAPLVAAGLRAELNAVMTADTVSAPPRPNTEADIRALASDDDWAQQLSLTQSVDEDFDVAFATATVAAQRSLVDAGHGIWWGAFLDGALMSSLGLVGVEGGLARFQEVKTHPDARRRGLAGTLVHHAGRHSLDNLGATTLVMVADPDDSAIRIYRSVGFHEREVVLQAAKTP